MATCKDCIHWAVCKRRNKSISLDPMKSGYKCPDFKNKADVQEVKHGEWIYHSETYNTKSGFTCSVCKDPMWHSPDVKQAFKYCPHCGAKMDKE